jgi:hypothetical protein
LIELSNISNTRFIQQKIGVHYSFFKKLKLGGVGSTKVVYLKGVSVFDEIKNSGQDLDFVNFELYPKGLIIRYSKGNKKKGLIIHKSEIDQILFESTKVKVHFRNGTKIVHEAVIKLLLDSGSTISFYVPVSFYKSTKPYWLKDWLADIIIYKENPAKPRIDSNGHYLGILQSILRL